MSATSRPLSQVAVLCAVMSFTACSSLWQEPTPAIYSSANSRREDRRQDPPPSLQSPIFSDDSSEYALAELPNIYVWTSADALPLIEDQGDPTRYRVQSRQMSQVAGQPSRYWLMFTRPDVVAMAYEARVVPSGSLPGTPYHTVANFTQVTGNEFMSNSFGTLFTNYDNDGKAEIRTRYALWKRVPISGPFVSVDSTCEGN